MFSMRTSAWLIALVAIGCSDRVPDLAPVTEGAAVVLEPGYVSLPPLPNARPPAVRPSCHPMEEASSSPAIEIRSSGGFVGAGAGNVQIWEDGTVLFDGAGCPNGSRRRGKMSAARVTALLDKLEKADFFEWPCKDGMACPDMFVTSLAVHRGRSDNTVVDSGCDPRQTNTTRAVDLVMQSVGKNACSIACLATPSPESCR